MITRETTWTSQSGRKATLGTMPTGHILNARAYLQRQTPYKIVDGVRFSDVRVDHAQGKASLTTKPIRMVVEKTINEHTYNEWIAAFTMELIDRGRKMEQLKGEVDTFVWPKKTVWHGTPWHAKGSNIG